MARVKWSIRNYNAFLREAKRELGLTHKQAQGFYKDLRYDLDRPLYGVDVKRELAARDAAVIEELEVDYGIEDAEAFTAREYYEAVELPEDWLMEGEEMEESVDTEGETP